MPTLWLSTDPALRPAYRLGQLAACAVAILFVIEYGMVVAGIGLVIALVGFRVFYVIVRGVVFPLIEITSRAVSRALRDD